MKKLIVFVLSLLIALQVIPVAVMAEDDSSQNGQESQAQVSENEKNDTESLASGDTETSESDPASPTRMRAGETDALSSTAPTALWIDPSETNGIKSRIYVFENTAEYQLFLPGNAVLSECFLSWDGDMMATVDNQTYETGSCPISSLETEKTYDFNNESQTIASYNITVYQGSADVQPVYIVVDESGDNPTIAQMDSDPNHEVTCTGQINIGGQWYEMSKIKGRGNVTWEEADYHPSF